MGRELFSAHSDGDEDDSRAREKVNVIQALPYGVLSAFFICVQGHL